MKAKPAMSRGTAADLASRLESGAPEIRSEQERKRCTWLPDCPCAICQKIVADMEARGQDPWA